MSVAPVAVAARGWGPRGGAGDAATPLHWAAAARSSTPPERSGGGPGA